MTTTTTTSDNTIDYYEQRGWMLSLTPDTAGLVFERLDYPTWCGMATTLNGVVVAETRYDGPGRDVWAFHAVKQLRAVLDARQIRETTK